MFSPGFRVSSKGTSLSGNLEEVRNYNRLKLDPLVVSADDDEMPVIVKGL